MKPLRIEARIVGAIALPNGPLLIDGILAAAVAVRDQLPPPANADACVPIEIPLAKEPGGRFHLASFSTYRREASELRWLNRRPVIAEAQTMGDAKLRKLDISSGANKGYRIPLETMHLEGDALTWWAIGDADEVRELLELVPYLGKKRSVGLGRVREWIVEECEPWGDGFPVVRDGHPTRPLPLDWPGLVEPNTAIRCITYPYWAHTREVLCAVP